MKKHDETLTVSSVAAGIAVIIGIVGLGASNNSIIWLANAILFCAFIGVIIAIKQKKAYIRRIKDE